jgi:Ni/Co efflux regulator RcnB
MKTYLLLGAALLLVAPDIASAQDHGRPGGGGQHGRPSVTKPAPSRPAPPRPSRPGAGRPEVKPTPSRPGRPGVQPPRPVRPKPPVKPRPPGRPGHGSNKPRPPHRPGYRPPNIRPIHRPGWRYPPGYAYRRWTIGLLLPHLFLSQAYYFDDYATYGYGPPPYGCRWVRYGPDLLLVDVNTGRIRDVIYGAFD